VIELASEHAITIFVDFQHENRKSKAEGEIRTRVVASTGPLPLPTAQMCHKTSFDLSCRAGYVLNAGVPWLYHDVNKLGT